MFNLSLHNIETASTEPVIAAENFADSQLVRMIAFSLKDQVEKTVPAKVESVVSGSITKDALCAESTL